MKKILGIGLVLVMLTLSVMAAPWKSNSGKTEEIAYSNGETLLKMETGDGGFQLWITGGREWHCIYKPEGKNSGNGWLPSSWAPGYMYKCNVLDE